MTSTRQPDNANGPQAARQGGVAPLAEPPRELSPAARRALAEAAERRRLHVEAEMHPKEIHGRGGSEPVRFGDWEVKGLAVDF